MSERKPQVGVISGGCVLADDIIPGGLVIPGTCVIVGNAQKGIGAKEVEDVEDV